MMKYFVYYEMPDFGESMGLESFEEKDKALEFINTKLKAYPNAGVGAFILIQGRALNLKAVQMITAIVEG